MKMLRQSFSRSILLNKFGNLSIRERLVVTSAYACPPAQTLGGGGERGSQDNLAEGRECHLFLAENRAVLSGNRRFSWREIALPPSLLKKSVF